MNSAIRQQQSTSVLNIAGERIDLAVTSTTCAACARRIERKPSKTPGDQQASLNFATARATVNYDFTSAGVDALIAVVKDVGYNTAGIQQIEFIVDDSARAPQARAPRF